MSTATTEKERTIRDDDRIRIEADAQIKEKIQGRSVEYNSIETGEKIELSIGLISEVISVLSKSGNKPSQRDCFLFMKLCEARKLNPIVGDAYMIGFDTSNGTKWNMIVAHSALMKRAELSGHFKGLESGVIVVDKDTGEIVEMPGDFFIHDRHELVGAWARVHRDDRTIQEYDRVNFSVFDTGYSRWAKDPGGMIVKVAEASVLRRAFPGETAGMYVREEMDHVQETERKRKFEVEPEHVADITDDEDRLKKNTTKRKIKKTPAKAKVEKEIANAVEEQVQSGQDAVVTPETESVDKVIAEQETPSEPNVEAIEGELIAEDGEIIESPAVTEAEEFIKHAKDQADESTDIGLAIDMLKAVLAEQKMIRKVRTLRDQFISDHELSEEERSEVEVAAKAVEDRLREEMAG